MTFSGISSDWEGEREEYERAIRNLEEQIAGATNREAKLIEALEFYANRKTYQDEEADRLNREGGFFPYGLDDTPISQDVGNKARTALKEEQTKEGE